MKPVLGVSATPLQELYIHREREREREREGEGEGEGEGGRERETMIRNPKRVDLFGCRWALGFEVEDWSFKVYRV